MSQRWIKKSEKDREKYIKQCSIEQKYWVKKSEKKEDEEERLKLP